MGFGLRSPLLLGSPCESNFTLKRLRARTDRGSQVRESETELSLVAALLTKYPTERGQSESSRADSWSCSSTLCHDVLANDR